MSGDRPNWLKRLFSRVSAKPPRPTPLELIEGGFAIIAEEGRIPVRWADVKEVFAFKRDIFRQLAQKSSEEGVLLGA